MSCWNSEYLYYIAGRSGIHVDDVNRLGSVLRAIFRPRSSPEFVLQYPISSTYFRYEATGKGLFVYTSLISDTPRKFGSLKFVVTNWYRCLADTCKYAQHSHKQARFGGKWNPSVEQVAGTGQTVLKDSKNPSY